MVTLQNDPALGRDGADVTDIICIHGREGEAVVDTDPEAKESEPLGSSVVSLRG